MEDQEKNYVPLYVSQEVHTKIKIEAAKRNISMIQLLEETFSKQ